MALDRRQAGFSSSSGRLALDLATLERQTNEQLWAAEPGPPPGGSIEGAGKFVGFGDQVALSSRRHDSKCHTLAIQ
jgi:hypothetical protein